MVKDNKIMEKVVSNNESETCALGYQLGLACRGGEVFLLCGDLGSGKTKLAQGLAAGLGVSGVVNSPTFNIMKLYQVSGLVKSLCHNDAYRLNSAEDLVAIGALDYLGSSAVVTVIEWAERVKKIWTPESRIIQFKNTGKNKRLITLSS